MTIIRHFLLLVVVSFVLSGCPRSVENREATDLEPMKNLAPPPPKSIPNEIKTLVESYVASTRHWARDSFTMSAMGVRGGHTFILVSNKEDWESQNNQHLGAGKSFFVEIDPQSMKVIKEGQLD
jgi:hypothetical protein